MFSIRKQARGPGAEAPAEPLPPRDAENAVVWGSPLLTPN